MKQWLGSLSRASVEFFVALLLVGGSGALEASLRAQTPQTVAIFREVVSSMLVYMPIAGLIALFLSYFTVESRVAGRFSKWLALALVALLPLLASVELERFPLSQELRREVRPGQALASRLPADRVLMRGALATWIGAWKGDTAIQLVGSDFSSPPPHLAYAPSANFDPSHGLVFVGGRSFPATIAPVERIELLPEAEALSHWWIWDRLADQGSLPPVQALAVAAGFGLLAAGLRFMTRLSSWTLANAFLLAAALLGILVLDALAAKTEVRAFVEQFGGRIGLELPYPLVVAAAEGGLGILGGLLGALTGDAPRRRFNA